MLLQWPLSRSELNYTPREEKLMIWKKERWVIVGIQATLTRAKLLWPQGWVRTSPARMQLIPIKGGPRKGRLRIKAGFH